MNEVGNHPDLRDLLTTPEGRARLLNVYQQGNTRPILSEPRLVDVVMTGGTEIAKARAKMVNPASERDTESAVAAHWNAQDTNASITDLLQRATESSAPGQTPTRADPRPTPPPGIVDVAQRIFSRLRGVERY
jgi:hypothetical protein